VAEPAAGVAPARVWSSRLDGAETTALASVGFRPVGVVMAVASFSPYTASALATSRTILKRYPCRHQHYGRLAPAGHLDGLTYSLPDFQESERQAFSRAHDTLLEEARGLGAHGVIGVTISWLALTARRRAARQLMMTGTAVLTDAADLPATPFTTSLSPTSVVEAVLTGRAPVRLVGAFACTSAFLGCAESPSNATLTGNSWHLEARSDQVDLALSNAVSDLSRQGDAAGADEILEIEVQDDDLMYRPRTTFGRVHAIRAVGTAVKAFDTGLSRVAARQVFLLRNDFRHPGDGG
jgi:uncharacterized protein YbjQ (UPF0145 family)